MNIGPGLSEGLGHRSIQHTVRYTELAPDRFKDFWRRSAARNQSAAFAVDVVAKHAWGEQ
jgi:hypothetical protein